MLDCEVVRDLLPLYTEQMVSAHTAELVTEHLRGCQECEALCRSMTAPQPQVQFSTDTAKQFAAYEKKQKRKSSRKVALLAAAGGALFYWIFSRFWIALGAAGVLMVGSAFEKVQTDTDPAHYLQYMGENADKKYLFKNHKVDERIFPEKLTDNMDVREYKMVYYNPWDPQYLSYLTVAYSPEDYEAEKKRLKRRGIADYEGSYGVTGFPGGDPLAVAMDSYYGYVYAINTPGQENTITYCEMIFCNCCMDLDYEEYMPAEYLPLNFNARSGHVREQEAWIEQHPPHGSIYEYYSEDYHP